MNKIPGNDSLSYQVVDDTPEERTGKDCKRLSTDKYHCSFAAVEASSCEILEINSSNFSCNADRGVVDN